MDSNGFNNEFDTQQTYESNEAPALDKGAVFAEKIRAIFASKAFLTATVAYTVMAGASLIWASIDIFAVLFTIGMWLVHTTATKGVTLVKDMKFLSGVVKAYYIVSFIGIVCLIVSSVIMFFVGPAVMKAEKDIIDIVKVMEETFEINLSSLLGDEVVYTSLVELLNFVSEALEIKIATFIGIMLIALGVIFIISAGISLVINEFFVHKLSKQFKKAVAALTVNSDTDLYLDAIRIWFMVFGIFAIISAVSTFFSFNIFMTASEVAKAIAYFSISSAIKEYEGVSEGVKPLL